MPNTSEYDVVIVGSGIAGSIIAYNLGKEGKKVLILEAGPKVPVDRSPYMKSFFKSNFKTPESPYPPKTQDFSSRSSDNPFGLPDPGKENTPRYTVLQINAWRNSKQCYFDYPEQDPKLEGDSPNAKFAFGSSYERIGGGTTWHWLGTSLRFLPNDFILKTKYGVGEDWPGGKKFFDDLVPYYEKATNEIGVSGDKKELDKLYSQFEGPWNFNKGYNYPMPGIEESMVDKEFQKNVDSLRIDNQPVFITPTPQGRNSLPTDRRQCAGNTNCIPICPIQAKYDATVTLAKALQTGNVEVRYQHVASNIQVYSDTDEIKAIDFITHDNATNKATGKGTVTAKKYVLAAHAIETPKLLLMSNRNKNFPNGVANKSGQVGRNLMDHIMYLAWGLAKDPVYPYRGPLSTSGIEALRDGAFRKNRAAYRIEIGNDGWNWAKGDPFTTLADFIFGFDQTQLNGSSKNNQGQCLKYNKSLSDNSKLFGKELISNLNGIYARQLRLGYLIEQLPNKENRVELSDNLTDNLGLPRPKVTYKIEEDYVREAFLSAKKVSTKLFDTIGAKEYTEDPGSPNFYPAKDEIPTATNFQYKGENFKFYGAGHIVGTYRMGESPETSVLNNRQQSWDHKNLYMAGSGVFPTITTANPTLTIAALAIKLADNILEDF